MGAAGYDNGFELTLLPERLQQPFRKKKPTRFFVNSMSDLFHEELPSNIWLGVTVVDRQSGIHRIGYLRNVDAAIRFLSVEPLLEDLGKFDLTDIHWVIVGGESGPKARPMNQDWVLSIKEQCEKSGSAFFFKQWGTWGIDRVKRNKKANGRLLLGQTWNAYPKQTAAGKV